MKLRVIALALTLILAFSPIALASDYGSITLSNFHFELGDQKPQDVNLILRAGYGGLLPDGPARLDIEVSGGGKTAFSGSAAVQDGALKVLLEKSRYFFQIPTADFEEGFFDEAQYEMSYLPMYLYSFGMDPYDYYDYYDSFYGQKPLEKQDVQKLFELLGRYVELLKRDSQPEASRELTRRILEQLKPEAKGAEEVTVFGQTMRLYRFDLTLEESDFHQYTEAFDVAAPEYKALDDELDALLKKMDGDAADEDGKEGEDPEEDILKDAGFEKIAYTLWSDTEAPGDPASKVRKESCLVTVKDAVDEYGIPVTLTVPFTAVTQASDQGERTSMEMAIEPYEGESYKFAFNGSFGIPERGGGASSNFSLSANVDSEENGVVMDAALTGHRFTGADGVTRLDTRAGGTMNGQDFTLRLAWNGATASSGTVSFSYDIPSGANKEGGMPQKAAISFDAKLERGGLTPLSESDVKDLQPVNPLRASQKVMDAVDGDMYGALMQGVGVLMQTKGLSPIIGGLMNAA